MSTKDKVLAYLSTFKRQKDNSYRGNSPLRSGSDSNSFVLTFEEDEKGVYYDHVSGESGTLYDLAKKLDIELPEKNQVENTKRTYHGIEDYARAHGVTADLLVQWHWRETVYQKRPALEFATRTGPRWRFLDGNKPPFKSPPDYQRCWYGLSEYQITRLEAGKPLIICNGEISVVAAQHQELAAVAVTGGEKGEIPPQLLDELRGKVANLKDLKIIVAMDCDRAGRIAARGIREQLEREKFNVRAVDLQLGRSGDLADFCMLRTDKSSEALEKLSDLPYESDDDSFHFYTLPEMLKMPPMTWLLPGVLPSVGIGMVFGASGVGKSFFTFDLAYKVAFKKPVIYVAAEGETGVRQRIEALIKHHKGETPDKLSFLLDQVDLFDNAESEDFLYRARRHQPALIIMDTLARCTGSADENSTRDIKTVIDNCKMIACELACFVLFVHHTNKGGKQARGNGRLFNDVDTVIRLAALDDVIAVESLKTKDDAQFKTYHLRRVSIDLGYKNADGKPVNSLVLLPAEQVVPDDQITDNQRAVLELIEVEPTTSLTQVADVLEVSRGAAQRILKELQHKGYITPFDGEKRSLTELGQKTLSGESPSKPDDAAAPAAEQPAAAQQEKLFPTGNGNHSYATGM